MKVLIVGSGAREHAIAWKIHQDPKVELFAAPGNGGTESFAQNLPGVDITSGSSVVDAARFVGADLVVVGPEAPLACGVVNTLDKAGIPSFGPSMEAAQIETSKSFAIEMMRRKRIPHAPSWFFNNDAAVENFARNYGKPVAVKPDGLSGGKGVQICSTPEEAAFAARACMRISPRRRIVVQEVLEGQEVSVFGFTDGYSLSSLVAGRLLMPSNFPVSCAFRRRASIVTYGLPW
ncbi:hypothetical protein KKI17_03475 [Patescibacteria group bacterium]|nr:hypothetical protein [Patescibacteria group bacterium]